MLNFNFDANNYEEKDSFELLPAGDYRVRIAQAEEAVSKAGNQMVKVTLDVSGKNNKLWYYLVISDDAKKTNDAFQRFFLAFGIARDNPAVTNDPSKWVGAVGAVRVKHEDYNGEMQAKVQYVLDKKRQATLPAWVEPKGSSGSGNSGGVSSPSTGDIPAGFIPFDVSDTNLI